MNSKRRARNEEIQEEDDVVRNDTLPEIDKNTLNTYRNTRIGKVRRTPGSVENLSAQN